MPPLLTEPVLTLDAGKMHNINPRNVESLFGMWTVFSKCSHSIKDGPRLENMSWRIWARETLCCPPQPEKTIVPAIDVPSTRTNEVPSLSNSVGSDDSSSDDDTASVDSKSRHSLLYDEDSALSKSRGNETHMTALRLEKIVVTIQEKTGLGPLSPSFEASLPVLASVSSQEPQSLGKEMDEDQAGKQMRDSTESCMTTSTNQTESTTRQSEHRDSDTSVSSDGLIRTGSVVHGFSPISTSYRPRPSIALPAPATSKLIPKEKGPIKPGVFTLGGSSEDEDGSFEQRFASLKPTHQRSSLSQSLTQQDIKNAELQKKTTSFKEIVEAQRIREDAESYEGAIESSDEEDDEEDIMDSAIDEEDDDDDDGDWEDSNSEDGKALAPEQHLFRRVDSRANLVSRRSMLTSKLNQADRESALISQASRSSPALRRSRTSSPTGPSIPGSPDEHEDEGGLVMQAPKSRPMPIMMTGSSQRSMAHSPRTTRRNMLSTELTESLRKNLLWERQQKSQTANAFLKRSRNAQSMANLQVHVAPTSQPTATGQETSKNNSWNHYFENPWEYHAKGW